VPRYTFGAFFGEKNIGAEPVGVQAIY